MLLNRYGTLAEINEMEVMEGIDLIIKAFEKRNEEKAFQLYLMRYQHMNENTYISFDEFYKPQSIDTKSEEEILMSVKEILDANKGRWRL